MLELVNNLQIAFEARINKLDWMSDSTKAKAKEKLHAFTKKDRISGQMERLQQSNHRQGQIF